MFRRRFSETPFGVRAAAIVLERKVIRGDAPIALAPSQASRVPR